MIEQPKKALLENFLNTFYCKYAEISIYYEKFCPRDWSDSKLKRTPLAFKLPYAPDQSSDFCMTHALHLSCI